LTYFVWQNPTGHGSTPSKSAKRRRSSGQSKAFEETPVISPGSDLKLLINPLKAGGIVHAIQPILVPEIIARVGMRWWNAHCNLQVTNVLREVVVKHNLGNFGPSYDQLREAKPGSEMAIPRILRTSHAHAAKNHQMRMAAIVAKLFRQTKDPAVNYVKSKVFGIENGAPILGDDHPLVMELKALPIPGAHVMFWAICFKFDHRCFLQMTRRWFLSRTGKTRTPSPP
jgi:hypothetical protein